MKRVFFDPEKCECWDCGKTFSYFGTESPMVNDDIWKIVAQDEPRVKYYSKDGDTWEGGGYLCKDCMEKRLGRPLEYEDLMLTPNGKPVIFNRWFIEKYFPEHLKDF